MKISKKNLCTTVVFLAISLVLCCFSGCSKAQPLASGTVEVSCNSTTITPKGYDTETFLDSVFTEKDTPSVGDLSDDLQEITCKKSDLSNLRLRLKGTHDDKVLFSVYDTGYRIQSFETEAFTVPSDSGKYYICVRVKWLGDAEMGTNPEDYIYTNYYYQLNIEKD